ncbi:hypothetical protein TRFO_34237 [Tritrichomonas foetus]|uniref:Uncharacterized protein n=1 Tax=Tritrichomonas foetus TaxID=1144522 RepID=A0A1J4JQ26_9EUKA|nr:hypothetical protein TRFO_34237 [Tritrichomonas foetus]|eukprot:OHS99332.1 hypothetical protein TRFO_34237 [Tritrichomonas foetus]
MLDQIFESSILTIRIFKRFHSNELSKLDFFKNLTFESSSSHSSYFPKFAENIPNNAFSSCNLSFFLFDDNCVFTLLNKQKR